MKTVKTALTQEAFIAAVTAIVSFNLGEPPAVLERGLISARLVLGTIDDSQEWATVLYDGFITVKLGDGTDSPANHNEANAKMLAICLSISQRCLTRTMTPCCFGIQTSDGFKFKLEARDKKITVTPLL